MFIALGTNAAHSSGLPLTSQKLQLLLVTEFYENVNGPLVIIVMWADLDLASTTNPCSSRKIRRITRATELTIKRR